MQDNRVRLNWKLWLPDFLFAFWWQVNHAIVSTVIIYIGLVAALCGVAILSNPADAQSNVVHQRLEDHIQMQMRFEEDSKRDRQELNRNVSQLQASVGVINGQIPLIIEQQHETKYALWSIFVVVLTLLGERVISVSFKRDYSKRAK